MDNDADETHSTGEPDEDILNPDEDEEDEEDDGDEEVQGGDDADDGSETSGESGSEVDEGEDIDEDLPKYSYINTGPMTELDSLLSARYRIDYLHKLERNTTPAYMTSYEYAQLITERAKQLGSGEKPLISEEDIISLNRDTLKMAKFEIDLRLPPISVVRLIYYGNKTFYELWPIKDLKTKS